jgi:hypothetical protein
MQTREILGALAIVVSMTTANLCWANGTTPAPEETGTRLVVEALQAVGVVDASERLERQREVRRALDRVVSGMGQGRPTYRRAARLHRLLHREFFLHYREDADGLDQIARAGEFNCLSATLFYGLAARELGYEVEVLESPGHVRLGLEIRGRRIDVETTSPRGFDRRRRASNRSRETTDMLHGVPGVATAATVAGARAGSYTEFPLESAVGFAWLNTAWRALEAGDSSDAARRVLESRRFLPDLSTQEDRVRRLLSRAFRTDYESGRFESAYRIAAVEVGLFPTTTTARDRLLAAAVKRVEDLCDADTPGLAEAVVADVRRVVVSGLDLTRFERRAWPLVTAAAVRHSDWGLARRAAENYAEVEPDSVEARRVVDWVARRRSEAVAVRIHPECFEGDPTEPTSVSH